MQPILFVCLGNICRSPAAEAIFRARARAAGLTVGADSAGTGAWHLGEPPHPPMIAAAQARGYDLTALRARRLEPGDFRRFGQVLVMDRQNLRDATALWRKAGGQGPAPRLFLDYAPGCGFTEMPDPWYTGEFDLVLDLAEAVCDGLIAALRQA